MEAQGKAAQDWDKAVRGFASAVPGGVPVIIHPAHLYKDFDEFKDFMPKFAFMRLFADAKPPERPKDWTDSGADVFIHSFKEAYVRGLQYPGQEIKLEADEKGEMQGVAGGGVMTLNPGERALIGTGLAFQVPIGYEIQVRPRSGNARKLGLTVLNAPGTVDSSYRGECGVIIINHGLTARTFRVGEPIAQIVACPVELFPWTEVEELSDTSRGSDGFGSTGTVGEAPKA